MRAYSGRYEGQPDKILQAYNDLFSAPPWIVGLDTETVSTKDQTIIGVGFATPGDDNFYFSWPDEVASIPWHLFQKSEVQKVWHNATFDLGRCALGAFNCDLDNIHDSAIITRLLNIPTVLTEAASYVGVKTRSVKSLFTERSKETGKKVSNMLQLPQEWTAHKCMRDAKASLQIYLQKRWEVNDEYYQMERDMTSLLLHMSHRGIKLDQELVSRLDIELQNSYELFYSTCKAKGFNPHSPEQIAWMLANEGMFLPVDWKSGKKFASTKKSVLEEIDHPIATMTLMARKYKHLWGIVHGLVGKERAYSNFHMDAATGRIASFAVGDDELQMHNIPTGRRDTDITPKAAPIRRIFQADSVEGFTIWDLSQIELRVLQQFTKDDALLKALEMSGGLHSFVQKELGIYSRVQAKNYVFGGFVYGGSVGVLAQFTGIRDTQVLQAGLNKLNALFPISAKWIQNQREEGFRDLEVQTLMGRVLKLAKFGGETEKHIKNCAINYPIQGSAGEIFKKMLLERAKTIPVEDLILQVHDEGLEDGRHDLPEGLDIIAGFKTPIEVKEQPTMRWQ